MTSKLEGFSSVDTVSGHQYRFIFTDKNPVFVLWSKDGDTTIDFSYFADSPSVTVTHIIEDEGQTEPVIETVPATAVPVNDSPIFVEGEVSTGVEVSPAHNNARDHGFSLEQNYPNPFKSQTTIEYPLRQSGHVILQIYNPLGQVVKTLVNENQLEGSYSIVSDGKDDLGESVVSGVYFFRSKVGNKFSQTRKLLLLK